MIIKSEMGLSVDELLRLASDRWIEIVNGEIVEMAPNGVGHHRVTGNIYRILDAYVLTNDVGEVFMDGLLCILKEDEDKNIRETRVPDTCFIRKERLPPDDEAVSPFHGAPDLVIEVASPDETADIIAAKIKDYFAAGAEQVWVADPVTREVHQHRRDTPGNIRVYREAKQLDVDSLFPGLTLTTQDFFAMPARLSASPKAEGRD